MTNHDEKRVRELLKAAIPPINPELEHDLWPAMLNRMQAPETGLCWYDWTLIAGLCGWLFVYPQGILQLLYQL